MIYHRKYLLARIENSLEKNKHVIQRLDNHLYAINSEGHILYIHHFDLLNKILKLYITFCFNKRFKKRVQTKTCMI